ncbi:S-adenosyl-L-methionine-dependent methyltransferase [Zopfochytrium polystomum]|nr:S-adenosyl-L-methionine-dependent methyltransferase [Zopfochytrium polystomum]
MSSSSSTSTRTVSRNVTFSDPNRPVPKADPNEDNFINSLRKKAKDANAHKAAIDGYLKNWEADKRNLANTEDATEERRLHSKTYTNAFYDLVTDFYEYGKLPRYVFSNVGWGRSFHFARMFKDTPFHQNIARQEDYLALKLGLKPGMKALDCGCGVGGPLREIVKFSGAHVTGINNNEYQVKRCDILAAKAGLSKLCAAVQGDFCNMQFADGTFDAAYGIEATVHAPRLEDVYGEVFRVLKPGGKFAAYEWCTTGKYQEADLKIKEIVHLVEEGNSVAEFYTIPECIQALKNVGFEIIEYKDLAENDGIDADALNPWYEPLLGSYNIFDVSQWGRTPLGRTITDTMVAALEFLRIAPAGTGKVSKMLNSAADNLVLAGKEGVFTPMFFFLVRKPEASA